MALEEIRRKFSEWYISMMVLFSLLIQTTLLLTGSRRKYTNRGLFLQIVRFAYMFADWVALVSLSLITNSQTSAGNAMRVFWAPFLFLHLGGADTITAYYLEDNQTWKRTCLTFFFQVLGFISAFIILTTSSGHILKVLSIFVALAGIIKLSERICANMRASSKRLKKSMLTPPDPGPNYAKYMDEYCSKTAEGFEVKSEKIDDAPMVGHNFHTFQANNFIPEAANLLEANSFFKVFKCLFADLILSMHDIFESQSLFQGRSSDEVFRVIEIELSFMFDLLYTKALVIYSHIGLFCRFVTNVILVSVLAVFSAADKKPFPSKDILVSYLLLAGAVLHEIFAICLILRSDYTMMWLSKRRTGAIHLLHKAFSCSFVSHNKRWCNKISQLNLISICLRENQTKNIFHGLTSKWNRVQCKAIPAELKELVFQQLLKKSRSVSEDLAGFKELCSHRGDWVIKNERLYHILGWSVEVEFDHSVLLWHIATDLCYNAEATDENEINDANAGRRPNHKELCKMLSEYMAYVLVERPYMFPDGIGQIRYRDTCAEAKEFFNERRSVSGEKKAASSALMKVCTDIPPSHVKGDRCKSVLFDGCRLAKGLRSLTVAEDKKWELISHIWVEMLCYAGNRCRRDHHAQELRRGGELLTHIWLLMAHLGITEQFQISEGHARTKLIVE